MCLDLALVSTYSMAMGTGLTHDTGEAIKLPCVREQSLTDAPMLRMPLPEEDVVFIRGFFELIAKWEKQESGRDS